jgi:gliding motility-associated-like protein
VYNGTGSDSDITGLTPGATYRVTVVDYLIIGFGERYIDPEITSASPNYVSSSLSPASFTTTTPYPTLEATKLKFSNITASSTTANWTSGNGSARAVFMHVGTSGSALPADNTTYSVNPKFGLGQQIGTTGWYCVYSGTGSSTNITDLSAGVTYRVTVVEYNGAPGHQKYDVTGLSPANVTTIQVYPTAPALQVKFTNTTNSGTTATWINGNGQKRAVFIRKGTDGAAIPLDNVTYTGNTIYQAGQQIGTTPWYCIYNGTASTTNIIGLLAGTAYRVTVVEYNGAPGSEKYMVTSLNPATVYTSGVAPLNGLFVNNNEVAPLTLTPGNQQIEANNVLSPNGDGVNDIWVVKNIAFYSNNTVTVYDKVGQVVYSKKNYANDWAGTYKGSTLNEGTYYYTINLGNGENVKGFLTVVKAK